MEIWGYGDMEIWRWMPGGELTVNLHVQCLQTKHNKVDFFYNSEWSSLCH